MIDSKTISFRNFEINADRSWFVLYSKPRQEAVAKLNLDRQGFETYFPRIAITKRRGTELIATIEPFFPRYLFVRFNRDADNWAPIRSTRGVCGLVRFEHVPKPVANELIDALMYNEDSQQLQRITEQTWKPGDRVAIEQGPFAGYHCIFQKDQGEDRVRVLLDIIGKQTHATLQKQDLQIPQFA